MLYDVMTISELKKQTKKNIYCFGAGRVFDSFMQEFRNYNLEDHIKAVADNNSSRIGTTEKIVNNVRIPIISLERMLTDIEENDCILITVAAFEEIIEQLEKIEKLNTIKYYIYAIMRVEQYDYERHMVKIPLKLSRYQEIQMPKTIHYCWFGKKKIPDQHRKWMESWKKYCPDYEIIEWNEDNYDVHKNRYISQAYDMNKWAFVSDYARIDIINEYGGVYLDTDVELIKNIDVMLMNEAFCGFESNQYINYGLGYGAKKHNTILQEIKEYYDNTNFILEDGSLNQVSCPVIQTEIMKKHGLNCNGEFQIIDGMTVYPARVLCGMSIHSLRIERDPIHTYAIHHFAASWLEDADRQRKTTRITDIKKYGNHDNYIYLD